MINRVLLVDDSKSARFALRKMLEGNGLQVDLAENADQALSYLQSERPDLIFMDHFMPGMNGFEAANQIRNEPETSAIPIVMCTSKDDDDYLAQARAHGATDILSKPTTAAALTEVLDKLEDTLEAMDEQPANAPNYDIHAVDASNADNQSVPVLDDVVLPVEEVRSLAKETAEQAVADIINERLSVAIESKIPEMRDMVMANFDAVAKSMIEGYVESAMSSATEQFKPLVESEIAKLADAVGDEAIAKIVKLQVEATSEQLQREVTEQVSEVYSSIGELKSNQHLKKIAPELMEDILLRTREAATETANESLLQVPELAKKSARHVAQEVSFEAMESVREDTELKLARALESGFESARQEASEVAWQEVTKVHNEMQRGQKKAQMLSGISLLVAIAAVAAALLI